MIDPAKVVRTALQDAASVASLLITTEALVADKPKKENSRRRAREPAAATWTTDDEEPGGDAASAQTTQGSDGHSHSPGKPDRLSPPGTPRCYCAAG